MVMTRWKNNFLGTILFLLSLSLFCSIAPARGIAKTGSNLLEQVLSLQLGMDKYLIGNVLTYDQKAKGGTRLVDGAYEGTYKLSDGDLFVVVDQKSDRVLALYKQIMDADKQQLRTMIADLMDRFAAPTTLAHDKILYWAFNKYGVISEEDYNKAKDIKQLPELGIIATVKLSSAIEIIPDSSDAGKEKEDAGLSHGTIYFIITSEPLVKQFLNNQG